MRRTNMVALSLLYILYLVAWCLVCAEDGSRATGAMCKSGTKVNMVMRWVRRIGGGAVITCVAAAVEDELMEALAVMMMAIGRHALIPGIAL